MVTVKREVDRRPMTLTIFVLACVFDTHLVSDDGSVVIRQVAADLPKRDRRTRGKPV